MRPIDRGHALVALLALLLHGTSAVAQPASPPPAPASPPPPSQADLDAIARALGADAQASPPPVEAPSAVATAVASWNPELAFIADFALAGFSRHTNLQGGGHDPTVNGFNLQGLEIAARADVDPYFKLDTNLVFGAEGFELEEAYATTLSLPLSLQMRAGQFLTRFGRANAMHLHQWDFVDQALVLGKMLGPDGNRGLGVEASWLTPLPWYLELVVSSTMASGGCCTSSFYGDDDRGVRGPQDLQTTGALKQFHALSSDWSLATGLSLAAGPNPSSRDAQSLVAGADLYVKYRPISRASATVVSLQVEALTRRRDSASGTLADSGLYAQLFFRFAERWATAGRYDLVTGTPNDPVEADWTGDRHRATANVTFYPTEFSRLRLQGSGDVPTYRSAPILAAFLALEVAIGAHGAHAF